MTEPLLKAYRRFFRTSDKYTQQFKDDIIEIIDMAHAQMYEHEIRRKDNEANRQGFFNQFFTHNL